jgi:alanine racemase
MPRRSQVTIDLGALARNVARLCKVATPAEVWAVVKADAYGHGAADCARAALYAGASALCVATAQEGAALRNDFPGARVLVMGPLADDEDAVAREGRLEVAVSRPDRIPDGLDVHLKVDTGMGRYGMTPEEALAAPRDRVVGLMSHLATADDDQEFARRQLDAFAALVPEFPGVTAHLANSPAVFRLPEAAFDAVRCGVALYGLSPFQGDPADDGLAPVLSWRSFVAEARTLRPGESTGYGRGFVVEHPTRIGLVPVGYADGFRRGLTGTEVLVDGARRKVVGRVSMDSFAVELRDEEAGAPVTLIGDGLLAEEHARVLGTINYEVTCGIRTSPERADRRVVGG